MNSLTYETFLTYMFDISYMPIVPVTKSEDITKADN